MEQIKKVPFNLAVIAELFELERVKEGKELKKWLSNSFDLNELETLLLERIHQEMEISSDYLNEEELKIRLIAPLFQIANIDEDNKIRVFYERSLSQTMLVKGEKYKLSVVCDCMIASSSIFKTPQRPYFFLQEFKKAKGEKSDPEAQMLLAMLAARKSNEKLEGSSENNPLYGGFLIGSVWRLATLVGNEYCTSRQFFATEKGDLLRIIYAIRNLKKIIFDIYENKKNSIDVN